jgi:hypothetical protein
MDKSTVPCSHKNRLFGNDSDRYTRTYPKDLEFEPLLMSSCKKWPNEVISKKLNNFCKLERKLSTD